MALLVSRSIPGGQVKLRGIRDLLPCDNAFLLARATGAQFPSSAEKRSPIHLGVFAHYVVHNFLATLVGDIGNTMGDARRHIICAQTRSRGSGCASSAQVSTYSRTRWRRMLRRVFST
jgi:hypothetical protein